MNTQHVEENLEVQDLGDAKRETKQQAPAVTFWDSIYGHGRAQG